MSLSRSTSEASSGWTTTNQGEMTDLIFKLQALLPDRNPPRHSKRVTSAATIMKEVCNYIRKLHQEVDDLSDKLSKLLASVDDNNTIIDPDTLRALVQHY